MTAALVTVVVPTLNAVRYLQEALESIVAQRYEPIEVLVVDGGSTDGTRELAAGFPHVRVLDQAGAGLPGAWNSGVAAARGELIAFLDADDRWLAGKLALQVRLLEDDPAVDCVFTRMRFVLEPGLPVPPGFRPKLLEGDHLAQVPSALLARRSLFDRVGSFDERWPIAADLGWFKRLQEAGIGVAEIPDVLVEKRVHDRNLSISGGPGFRGELLELLRESIERGRAV